MMTHNEDADPTPVPWRAEAATGTTTKHPADAAASADPANDAFARPVGTQHSVVSTALPQTATPRPAVTGTVGESSLSGVESKEYIRGVGPDNIPYAYPPHVRPP